MIIDEADILLAAALGSALPYAIAALGDWGRRNARSCLQECAHQIGARRHQH